MPRSVLGSLCCPAWGRHPIHHLLEKNLQRITRALIHDDRGPAANDTVARANYLDRINQKARNQP